MASLICQRIGVTSACTASIAPLASRRSAVSSQSSQRLTRRVVVRCEAPSPSSRGPTDSDVPSTTTTLPVAPLSFTTIVSLLAASSSSAAEEVAQIAETDYRPLILLFVMGPAVGWVLFNILKPALRQLDSMKGAKAVVGAAGLGAAMAALTPRAEAAQEVAQLADADLRPLILLLVLGPAVGWVLFNILQPALRQLQNMTNKK